MFALLVNNCIGRQLPLVAFPNCVNVHTVMIIYSVYYMECSLEPDFEVCWYSSKFHSVIFFKVR